MDCEIICPQSGNAVWTPTFGKAGTVSRVLSDFEEVDLLGEGAFGSVSHVKCNIDQQQYALKKIILEYDYGYERATREVIAMARLSHSNVVKYHTAWLEEGWAGNGAGKSKQGPMACILMELCFGCVKDLMGKTITDEKIWDIFRQTISGVDYIHSKCIRHGDLSPANIFLDEAREMIKIGDFGFSTAANGMLGFDEVRVQSFYGAPEVRSRSEVATPYSLKSDIYSLGVILMELFARYDAVEDVSRRRSDLTAFAKSGEFPGWTTDLDPEIRRLISAMTASDPKLRPTTGQILVLQPWAAKVK